MASYNTADTTGTSKTGHTVTGNVTGQTHTNASGGIKGAFAKVHGIGEAVRGEVNGAVDGAFGEVSLLSQISSFGRCCFFVSSFCISCPWFLPGADAGTGPGTGKGIVFMIIYLVTGRGDVVDMGLPIYYVHVSASHYYHLLSTILINSPFLSSLLSSSYFSQSLPSFSLPLTDILYSPAESERTNRSPIKAMARSNRATSATVPRIERASCPERTESACRCLRE
jgi:hypothetical protein